MIVPKRPVVQHGGTVLALCLAVLGSVVVLHLALHVLAHGHAVHHSAPDAQQSATGIAIERPTVADAAAPHDHMPSPCAPTGHDHSLCGAAAGAPITDARPLLPSGPAIGHLVIQPESTASPPVPLWRREQPVRPPSGAALLILKSVSRI
ncbi:MULTISPECIES: hypothetical protein [Streptosporangium]|uniref:Secreted protein n=1 Tax=Streptosporangium brasiliense TaxID=47480 RepID=A0ABT9RFY4_9ACTN|nr:hypothetical protein [Streptosporangium brasiliense]MDP9868196.1 hypothetical protein [Streptosporangium brasiliense]